MLWTRKCTDKNDQRKTILNKMQWMELMVLRTASCYMYLFKDYKSDCQIVLRYLISNHLATSRAIIQEIFKIPCFSR